MKRISILEYQAKRQSDKELNSFYMKVRPTRRSDNKKLYNTDNAKRRNNNKEALMMEITRGPI
eukprot:13006116-Heterocapsa_arctica.AAC.1